jgi:hypothetical protein
MEVWHPLSPEFMRHGARARGKEKRWFRGEAYQPIPSHANSVPDSSAPLGRKSFGRPSRARNASGRAEHQRIASDRFELRLRLPYLLAAICALFFPVSGHVRASRRSYSRTDRRVRHRQAPSESEADTPLSLNRLFSCPCCGSSGNATILNTERFVDTEERVRR